VPRSPLRWARRHYAASKTPARAPTAPREWTVRSQACDLVVYLVAVPPEGVGMTTYRLDGIKGCD